MMGGKVPPMSKPKTKKRLEVKDENKNTTPGTPQGKLQKVRDMIKAVVKELGAQSDMSASLEGLVRHLDMDIKKLGGADMDEGQINGMGDQGKPPLGVGTPGQVPANSGAGIASPVNPDTLTQNLMGAPSGGQF
jgi:hypothetical protein